MPVYGSRTFPTSGLGPGLSHSSVHGKRAVGVTRRRDVHRRAQGPRQHVPEPENEGSGETMAHVPRNSATRARTGDLPSSLAPGALDTTPSSQGRL